jgi:hypothetical protein
MEIIKQKGCNVVCVNELEAIKNGNLSDESETRLLDAVAGKCEFYRQKLCKINKDNFPDRMVFKSMTY